MLQLATAHIAHLQWDGGLNHAGLNTVGWGFKPSSQLIRRISLEISSYCAKQTNKLLLFSYGINTKYLIIVNNLFVI